MGCAAGGGRATQASGSVQQIRHSVLHPACNAVVTIAVYKQSLPSWGGSPTWLACASDLNLALSASAAASLAAA